MTQIVGSGVLYSLLPSLSRGSLDKSQQHQLEKAMGLLLNASFAVVLATMVFAGPIIRLVLGARYAESAVALKILIWAVIFRYLNYALNIGLLAAGYERVFIVTTSVCLAVNFFGNLLLIPRYSWRAAAVLTIVTDLVSVILNTYYIRRAVGRVILPFGAVRSSLAFVILVIATFTLGRFVSPLAAGTISLLSFFLYLYHSGMLIEFSAIWYTRRNPSAVTSQ
jgi:O-antigen/teichoic acid export membrane protein